MTTLGLEGISLANRINNSRESGAPWSTPALMGRGVESAPSMRYRKERFDKKSRINSNDEHEMIWHPEVVKLVSQAIVPDFVKRLCDV